MSVSTTAGCCGQAGGGVLTAAAVAAKRRLGAYITWRMEHCAIAVLRSMSDQDLGDIGLARADLTPQAHPRRQAAS